MKKINIPKDYKANPKKLIHCSIPFPSFAQTKLHFVKLRDSISEGCNGSKPKY